MKNCITVRTRVGGRIAATCLALGIYAALGAIQSKAADATNAVPKWETSAALGATVTKGNSDTLLFTLSGRGDKKWDAHELHLGADATYGEVESTKNNES